MKTKVLQETENKLFSRKEINIEIDHNKSQTPSRAELYKFMSVKFKAPAEQIVLKKMKTGFGSNKSMLKIYIYDNIEVISKIENKHFAKRREKAFEVKEKVEEKPAAEIPAEEESPVEETKEEVPEAKEDTEKQIEEVSE